MYTTCAIIARATGLVFSRFRQSGAFYHATVYLFYLSHCVFALCFAESVAEVLIGGTVCGLLVNYPYFS